MLAIGDHAPTLSIPTDTDMFSLAEQGGKKVVIFFFPRADTPGCTKEAEQFSALQDEFTAQDTVVIGVSKDKPAKQAKFRVLDCSSFRVNDFVQVLASQVIVYALNVMARAQLEIFNHQHYIFFV